MSSIGVEIEADREAILGHSGAPQTPLRELSSHGNMNPSVLNDVASHRATGPRIAANGSGPFLFLGLWMLEGSSGLRDRTSLPVGFLGGGRAQLFKPSAYLVGSGEPAHSSRQSKDMHGHGASSHGTPEGAIAGVFQEALKSPPVHQLPMLSQQAS